MVVVDDAVVVDLLVILPMYRAERAALYMFWAVRGHRPPTGGVHMYHAPRGHTGIADRDSQLL